MSELYTIRYNRELKPTAVTEWKKTEEELIKAIKETNERSGYEEYKLLQHHTAIDVAKIKISEEEMYRDAVNGFNNRLNEIRDNLYELEREISSLSEGKS